jgi:asparagine synthase (glutamine-hydrolysing)
MYLPRLLKWDDRNSMAFSVEGRYPLLDHELIELCLSFAPHTLYRLGWTKYPLRLGLRHKLPAKVFQRRSKFGFETPQDHWLCGTLRPALESWLDSDRPAWQYVAREDVRRLAEQTWRLKGKQTEPGLALFRIFIFDRWLEIFGVQY